MDVEVVKYLSELNQKIRKGCTAHITRNGRLYYMNHETKTASWLPPVESWDSGGLRLPYGWEAALDRDGKTYFINHVNKTTTCEDPRKDSDEDPPLPRDVELYRDPQKGFGFVAGSEKPVIVRFVTEGGPSEGKLLPGDQILQINGEDVVKSPREKVIELVRSCKHSVKLQVCQPITNNTTRKSALLTAAKKAKLKSNPSRVRFAEGVVINGSPLYCPSPFDSYVPFLPNVLKVFLENGQTKSFKYDNTTTVQDVLNVLQEKLSLTSLDHFALVVEHIKSLKRNKLSILNPKDTLAKIAARPGAHHLRCLFRLTFVPKDIYEFMQKDPIAFDYLFVQCCNDVVTERFAPELKYDVALRLAALHLHQHALNCGIQGKIIVKTIEREYGLEKFVPISLLDTMKRKELLKLLNQLMKQNQALSGPGQKQLTSLQSKFHYLKIVSDLPSYGAKSFATSSKNCSVETALLIGPRVGISQISTIRNIAPISLAQFGELDKIEVTREDEFSYKVKILLKHPEKESMNVTLEDREAEEMVLVIERYFSQLVGDEISVEWEGREPELVETVPTFHGRHTVQESPWSYCPSSSKIQGLGATMLRSVDLSVPPPSYVLCEERQLSRSNSRDQFSLATSPASVDHNMNEMEALVAAITAMPLTLSTEKKDAEKELSSIKIPRSCENAVLPKYNCESPAILSESNENHMQPTLTLDYETGQIISQSSNMKADSSYETPIIQHNASDQKDSVAAQLQNQMCQLSGIDMHSVMSIELLEEELDNQILVNNDKKSQDVISRVTEMSKIVNDAEKYLNTDNSDGSNTSEVYNTDLGSQTQDSLLFLSNSQEQNKVFDQLLTPCSDNIPSESEAESTPTNSPTHQTVDSPSSVAQKMCSSFGLHSPHLFASLDQETEDVEELLRQLQNSTVLPFEEGSLCLDPDIIDLTIVPPPIVTDADFTQIDGSSNFATSSCEESTIIVKTHSHIQSSFLGSHKNNEEETKDYLHNQKMPDEIDFSSDKDYHSVPHGPQKVDSSSCLEAANAMDSVEEDDLAAYIIPPPPSSSGVVEEQNRVLARFRQAAEDIRRMMAHSNDIKSFGNSKYSDSMNSVSKFCTIPRRYDESHRNNTSVLDSLVTPVRETHGKTGAASTSFSDNEFLFNGETTKYESKHVNHSTKFNTRTASELANTLNSPSANHFVSDSFPCCESTNQMDKGDWRPQPPPRLKRLSIPPSDPINGNDSFSPIKMSFNQGDLFGSSNHDKEQALNNTCVAFISKCSLRSLENYVQVAEEQASQHPGLTTAAESQVHIPSSNQTSVPSLTNGHHAPQQLKLAEDTARHYVNGLHPKMTNGNCVKYVNGNCNKHEKLLEDSHPNSLPIADTKDCQNCAGKKGQLRECVCKKLDTFLSYHQSLPRKANNPGIHAVPTGTIDVNGIIENGHDTISNGVSSFQDAQQEIAEMVLHLEATCQARLKECEDSSSIKYNASKLANHHEMLMSESRQFVTASKLFVKSITESSDLMEENLSTCLTLLDHIFTVCELVIFQMTATPQIKNLVDKLREMALAYSRTVQAAECASSGGIMNPNMASLMHQATSLATSLTTLMRTLRTFQAP